MVEMLGKHGELLRTFFNHVGLTSPTFTLENALYKFLTKLPVLCKGGSDLYMSNGLFYNLLIVINYNFY